uniref:Uncharacterized protein n=1 Tax=viral metagenome TaxID=1070528 RepID=A0A6H2A4C2_9ZZZZ
MSKKLSEYTDIDLAWGFLYFVILVALAIGGIALNLNFFGKEAKLDKQLQGVILFWQAKLEQRYLLNESTIALIQLTIRYLKELQEAADDKRRLREAKGPG